MSENQINRLSGIGVALFGAALLVWVIPGHTETVSYGWMRPATLPQICAVALVVLGAVLGLRPVGPVAVDRVEAGVVVLVAVLSAVAIWALGRVGFAISAPVFAAVLVAVIGERRWAWALAGIMGAPILIWLVVQVILNRPLP